MKASSYTITASTPTAIFLVDNGVGKSVTNDAENVITNVTNMNRAARVFVKDTMGNWDELVHNGGTFLRFAGIAPVTHEKFKTYFL